MAGNIARLGRRRHSIGFPAQPNDEIGRVFARFWLSNMQFIFKSNDVLDILGFLEMNSIGRPFETSGVHVVPSSVDL